MKENQAKDLALVIAWPQSWAKAPERIFKYAEWLGIIKSRFFQVGHAGLVIIKRETGDMEYYDYGRYTTARTLGRIRSAESDPKLKLKLRANFDNKGNIENLKEILLHMDSIPEKTHGDGPMHVSICNSFDFEQCKKKILSLQHSGSLPYRTFKFGSTNCAQFVNDAVRAGTKCTKTKWRLLFPLTLFRATPLGNVEAVLTAENYIVTNGAIEKKRRYRRPQVLKEIISSTLKNFSGNGLSGRFPDNLAIPNRHERVISEASWLPGLGEGTWLTLKKEKGSNAIYRIIGQSSEGELEYDYHAKVNDVSFDMNKPFQFTYDCSRLWASIIQEGRRYRFDFVEDAV